MIGAVEIGSLIDRDPAIRGGRPKIAGTGVTVMRVAAWYKMGLTPEEIATQYGHLSLAQGDRNGSGTRRSLRRKRGPRVRAPAFAVSRIRLYFDEDAMQHALLVALRARRIDILTASDCGMIGRSDLEHLRHASAGGRALYSFNIKDYSVLHE